MQPQLTNEAPTTKPAPAQSKPTPVPYQATPPVDVYESADQVRVFVDLPGVPVEAIALELEDETLTLTARREVAGQKRQVVYKRRFAIPRDIASEQIAAKLEDGVLALSLPKRAERKPRTVKVTTA